MRMLMNVKFPHEPFNSAVREGSVGQIMKHILEEIKPEAVYFTEQDGRCGAVVIININDPSEIPFFAEPWFLKFNAACEFRVAMTTSDLERAGLDKLGKTWG